MNAIKKLPFLTLTTACLMSLTNGFNTAQAADQESLNIYNWVDYIGANTISNFEKETGIKVTYDTYDAAETVDAKLMAGSTGYDVVIHSASMLPKLIKVGAFSEIPASDVTGYNNLDSKVLEILQGYDESNLHAIPYTWGTVGISYNVDLVKKHLPNAPLDSLDIIFKPENIKALSQCGVTFLDSPKDMIPLALNYLGLNPNSTNPSDYKKAKELLLSVRPYVQTFDSSNYLNALPNEEICVAMTWSGDYAVASGRAAEAGKDVNLAYILPKEGSGVWFDTWVIPKDAPHKKAAMKWIEYMLRPEVIAEVTNYVWYANANSAANEFVDPNILEDQAVYPTPEKLANMYAYKPLPKKINRIKTRAWSSIKTGS